MRKRNRLISSVAWVYAVGALRRWKRHVQSVNAWYWDEYRAEPAFVGETLASLTASGWSYEKSNLPYAQVRVTVGSTKYRIFEALKLLLALVVAPTGLGFRSTWLESRQGPSLDLARPLSRRNIISASAANAFSILVWAGKTRIRVTLVSPRQNQDQRTMRESEVEDSQLLAEFLWFVPTFSHFEEGENLLTRQALDLVHLSNTLPEATFRLARSSNQLPGLLSILDSLPENIVSSTTRALIHACRPTNVVPVHQKGAQLIRNLKVVPSDADLPDAYETRDWELITLQGVAVTNHFVLTQGNDLLIWDSANDPRKRAIPGQHSFVKCPHEHATRAVVESAPASFRTLDKAILLTGTADENWYHFLIETVPRLYMTRSVASNVPLLISSRVPPSGLDLISMLTHRSVIQTENRTQYKVKELILVAGSSTLADAFASPALKYPASATSALKWVRSVVELSQREEVCSPRVPVLLDRHSRHRRVKGMKSIRNMVERFGGKAVDPSRLTFAEQLNLFGSASLVISPGGAGLANQVFVPEAVPVVGLVADLHPPIVYWRSLSQVLGTSYEEVLLPLSSRVNTNVARLHRNVIISRDAKVRIRELLQEYS